MKPVLIEYLKSPDASFSIRQHQGSHFSYPLHFHPQYELTYVVEGYGTQYVGNDVRPFAPGEMVLMGRNVPHYWRNYQEYYQDDSKKEVKSIVLQFSEDFPGRDFLSMPESFQLNKLLFDAQYCFKIVGHCRAFVAERLDLLWRAKGLKRTIILLEILHEISTMKDVERIVLGTPIDIKSNDLDRMSKVINYASKFYNQDITLEEVAAIANMNQASFCKFFKKHYKKTFFEFVNEIRIGHACHQLRKGHYSITEICYLSGYNNFSNFSRMFKRFTAMTPSAYTKSFGGLSEITQRI